MTMTPEELENLKYKPLKTSGLIQILQHLLETEGDKAVYARDIDADLSSVYGSDVYVDRNDELVIYP